jgi:hypothetical protein
MTYLSFKAQQYAYGGEVYNDTSKVQIALDSSKAHLVLKHTKNLGQSWVPHQVMKN